MRKMPGRKHTKQTAALIPEGRKRGREGGGEGGAFCSVHFCFTFDEKNVCIYLGSLKTLESCTKTEKVC